MLLLKRVLPRPDDIAKKIISSIAISLGQMENKYG